LIAVAAEVAFGLIAVASLAAYVRVGRTSYWRSQWAQEFIDGATQPWSSVGAGAPEIDGPNSRGGVAGMTFGSMSPEAAAMAEAVRGLTDTDEGREIAGAHIGALLDHEERMRRVEDKYMGMGSSSASTQRSLTAFQREWLYAAKLEFPICKINAAQRATVSSYLRAKIKLAHPDMRHVDLWMHVTRVTTAYFIPTAEEILQAQVLQDSEILDRVRLAKLPEA